jgi:hypothetical protein
MLQFTWFESSDLLDFPTGCSVGASRVLEAYLRKAPKQSKDYMLGLDDFVFLITPSISILMISCTGTCQVTGYDKRKKQMTLEERARAQNARIRIVISSPMVQMVCFGT